MESGRRILLEALELPAAARAAMTLVLERRLEDAKTLALIAAGDPRRMAVLVHEAATLGTARPLRLGQILLAQGLVTSRALAEALATHRAAGRRIGAQLVADGELDPREVAGALWLQHKLRSAALALAGASGPAAAPPIISGA